MKCCFMHLMMARLCILYRCLKLKISRCSFKSFNPNCQKCPQWTSRPSSDQSSSNPTLPLLRTHLLALLKASLFCILLNTNILLAEEQPEKDNILKYTLEELMQIEVILPSRKEEKLFQAAAAVSVITSEEIRRSGFTSIPDVLRLVPGLAVAQIDANKWAISSRGFNGVFANKLLVLIDGRSVYSPLFSGVFWEAQDVLMEDIDQIEVIRGPGATLWGSNAVNGIINILTKPAEETPSWLATVGFGSEEQGFGGLRYGGHLGKDLHFRFYGKYFQRDNFADSAGNAAADAWQVYRGGFHCDWNFSEDGLLSWQGDWYDGKVGHRFRIIPGPAKLRFQTFDSTADIAGFNLLTRLKYQFSMNSEILFQFYADRTQRKDVILYGQIDTYDLDLQHQFRLGARQELIWGLGYRQIRDDIKGTFYMSLTPEKSQVKILNAFIQDEFSFANEHLFISVGSKFEQNDYSGLEIQPNFRFLALPGDNHVIWGAVSKAARTPSRSERDISAIRQVEYVQGVPALGVMQGTPDFDSEQLLAHELGYRYYLNSRARFDLALFYNKYDRLRSYEDGKVKYHLSPPPIYFMLPIYVVNEMQGLAYGGEVAVDWQISKWWSFRTAYAFLKMQMELDQNAFLYEFATGTAEETPQHQFLCRSRMNLGRPLEFDLGFRFIDKVPALNVDAYFNLDAALTWKFSSAYQLALVGQNLLAPQLQEYKPAYADIISSEVERGVYVKFTVNMGAKAEQSNQSEEGITQK